MFILFFFLYNNKASSITKFLYLSQGSIVVQLLQLWPTADRK